MVPAATVRKIRGREFFSFYRVTSLTAYKYLRRIIVLFHISQCITVQYLQYSQSLQYFFSCMLNDGEQLVIEARTRDYILKLITQF